MSLAQSVANVYLDEHLGDLAEPLRRSGHDVLSANEPARRRRTDAWHFREAVDDWRVILTLNRSDFLYLRQLWTTLHTMRVAPTAHAGVLSGIQTPLFDRAAWLGAVQAKLAEPKELEGQMLAWMTLAGDTRWRIESWHAEKD